ncbi:hypothetical protein NKH77_02075 [Streptomyces sp. M19]
MDLVVAALGVLKAGAAYVPLQRDDALARQEAVLSDAGPGCCSPTAEPRGPDRRGGPGPGCATSTSGRPGPNPEPGARPGAGNMAERGPGPGPLGRGSGRGRWRP